MVLTNSTISLRKQVQCGFAREKFVNSSAILRTWEPSLVERLPSWRKQQKVSALHNNCNFWFHLDLFSETGQKFPWMFQCCESLQELCRRVLIRSVGSRRLLPRLPLPRNVIEWLKEYEEPAEFDPNSSSDEVLFSNNNETITFNG